MLRGADALPGSAGDGRGMVQGERLLSQILLSVTHFL